MNGRNGRYYTVVAVPLLAVIVKIDGFDVEMEYLPVKKQGIDTLSRTGCNESNPTMPNFKYYAEFWQRSVARILHLNLSGMTK